MKHALYKFVKLLRSQNSHNADSSQVLWDGGPCIPIWPPTAVAKRMTSSPNHVLYIPLECRSLNRGD